MKRARRWILLTAAGIIIMLVGSRAQEAVVLDPDNLGAV